MPGILDSTVPAGINPGLLSAGNLVNANAPAPMNASAIQAMTDSMRTGALTAQDVIDRVGELGKTTRKAAIEAHKREIEDLKNPDLVAAKHAITLAGGAQANLVGTQAQAAQTLVPAQTQLQAGALAQGLSELGTGIPSATLRQLNLIYGLGAKFDPQTGVLQNPEEVLPGLSHIMGGLNGMQIGKELADRIETKPVTDPQGNTTTVPVWKGTGAPLSPTQKAVVNRYNSMMPGLLPGGSASLVQPNAPAPAVAPADVTPQPANTPAPATLPPTGPVVDANGNLVTAVRTDADKAKQAADFAESARKNQAVEAWRKAQPFYALADNAIHAINQIPEKEQNSGSANLNQRDFELADAVVKMLDPEGTVREFKWEKLASGQPVMDQVHAVMARLTNQGKFVPGVRQELMKVANDAIRAREKTAADVLQGASNIGGSMTPMEKDLVAGKVTPAYAPPSEGQPAAAAGGGVQTKTLNGRQMVSSDGGKTWNWVR